MMEPPVEGQLVECVALTPDRWPDLERLFGPRGACGGCWCMWWRLTRTEFERTKGSFNHDALEALVRGGTASGVLAYDKGVSIGWCAVEPRNHYPVLNRSRILKPVDEEPVWSVVCFFVAKAFRRKGVARQLLSAATAHAIAQGASIVEGYPVEPRTDAMPDPFAFTGTASTFRQVGFVEVARRSPTRPIMRYHAGPAGSSTEG